MKKLVIGFCLLIVVAIILGGHKQAAGDGDSAALDAFVLTDSAALMTLIDTLYQHIENDSIDKGVWKEEQWMNDYRLTLCAFYDKNHVGSNAISAYAKADSVLNIAERLYENDDDYTTAGMITRTQICSAIDKCREYGLLSELLACCHDEESKDLLYQETSLYEEMFKNMASLVTEITFLNYWGGSIVGPLCTSFHRQLSAARKEMYMTTVKVCRGERYENKNGVSLSCIEDSIFGHFEKEINDPVKNSLDWQKELRETDKESYLQFMKTAREAEDYKNKLKPQIKNWINLWKRLDEKLTTSDKRHHVELIVSNMLMEWAKISYSIKDEMGEK